MTDPTRPAPPTPGPDDILLQVVLTGEALTRLSPILEADRAQAVADLEADNAFALCPTADRSPPPGPYVLHLSIQEGRLVFDVRDRTDAPVMALGLALGPFRGLIKDYQMLVDSHMMAVEEGRADRIQAHRHGPTRTPQRRRRPPPGPPRQQGRHRPGNRPQTLHPRLRPPHADIIPPPA